MSDGGSGSMSAVFLRAVEIVLEHEGGLVDDPRDPGGITNMGISLRAYPQLGADGIRNLTREKAIAIYWSDYFLKYRLGQLPDAIAPKVLDSAVLCGPGTAIRLLQRAADALGGPCDVDGSVGPQTVNACRSVPADALLAKYRELLLDHFTAIVKADPGEAVFLTGWRGRAES